MKKAIMQNAGINIYENYFEDRSDGANVVQYYRHPNPDVTVRYNGAIQFKSFGY